MLSEASDAGEAAQFESMYPTVAAEANYVGLLKERLSDRRIEYAPFYSDLEYVFHTPINNQHECALKMCGQYFTSSLRWTRTEAKQEVALR